MYPATNSFDGNEQHKLLTLTFRIVPSRLG